MVHRKAHAATRAVTLALKMFHPLRKVCPPSSEAEKVLNCILVSVFRFVVQKKGHFITRTMMLPLEMPYTPRRALTETCTLVG